MASAGAPRAGWRSAAAPGLFALALLSGCAHAPQSASPVSWWHSLEGGQIAQDRPPPPQSTAPYPHIMANPQRPAGMPDWEWRDLQTSLAAQAAAANSYAAANPIPVLTQAQPSATKPGAAVPPGSGTPAPRQTKPQQPAGNQRAPIAATGQAAAVPSPAGNAAESDADAAAIRRLAEAQGPAGSSTSLPPAATIAAATAASGAAGSGAASSSAAGGGTGITFNGPTSQARSAGPAQLPVTANGRLAAKHMPAAFDANNGLSVSGALDPDTPLAQLQASAPALPSSVPAPPVVSGFAIPALPSTYAPPKAVPKPAPYVAPPPPPSIAPVRVSFAPHAAVLTPPMQRAIRIFLYSRQGAHIAAFGFGDAASDSLADQAAALPLALERARAILVQLLADGVPPADISTAAQARGGGGLVRLVD